MNNSTVKIIVAFFLVLLPMRSVLAEPPGGQGMMSDTVVLNGPCEALDAQSKVLALAVASVTGQAEATLPAETAESYLSTLKGYALGVQSRLVECWVAEMAYYRSVVSNRGTPGSAESARYSAAVDQTRTLINALPASVPGQNAMDTALNDGIRSFYQGWIDTFARHENLANVKGVHDRLREAFASLLQTSIECRKQSRISGVTVCSAVEWDLAELGFIFGERVNTTVTRLAPLNSSLRQQQSDDATLKGQMQLLMSVLQNLQVQLQGTIQTLSVLNYWAMVHVQMYYYYAAWANYFAAIGWWGHYGAFINAANQWLGGFYALVFVHIPYYQQVAQNIQGQMQRISGSEMPGLEQRILQNMMAMENTKGLIIAVPVAKLK